MCNGIFFLVFKKIINYIQFWKGVIHDILKTFLYELGNFTFTLDAKNVYFNSSQTHSPPSGDRCWSYCIKHFNILNWKKLWFRSLEFCCWCNSQQALWISVFTFIKCGRLTKLSLFLLGLNVSYFFYFYNSAYFYHVDARWQNALAGCAGSKLILGKWGTSDSEGMSSWYKQKPLGSSSISGGCKM